MPYSISTLSSAQIARVASASSPAEANHMNLLEKIIDWFKGGVQRGEVERLYGQISMLKSAARDSSLTCDFEAENDRLSAFVKLREMLQPEYREQFRYEFSRVEVNKFTCAITIAGSEIYRNPDIHGTQDEFAMRSFQLGVYGLQLEDAFRGDDAQTVCKVLSHVSNLKDEDESVVEDDADTAGLGTMMADDDMEISGDGIEVVDDGMAMSDDADDDVAMAGEDTQGIGDDSDMARGRSAPNDGSDDIDDREMDELGSGADSDSGIQGKLEALVGSLSLETQVMLRAKIAGEFSIQVSDADRAAESRLQILHQVLDVSIRRQDGILQYVGAEAGGVDLLMQTGAWPR